MMYAKYKYKNSWRFMIGVMACVAWIPCVYAADEAQTNVDTNVTAETSTSLGSGTGLISRVDVGFRTLSVGTKDFTLNNQIIIKDANGKLVNQRYLTKGMRIKYEIKQQDQEKNGAPVLQNIESPDGKPYNSLGSIGEITILSKVPEDTWRQ